MIVDPKPDGQMGIRVTIGRKLLSSFKSEAKKAYPSETYAILIGRRKGGNFYITNVFYPENVQEHCTEHQVNVKGWWWQRAQELADAANEQVLGDIHSHPFDHTLAADHAPSEADWCRLEPGWIHAICVVMKQKSGRLRATTKFWPSIDVPKMKVV